MGATSKSDPKGPNNNENKSNKEKTHRWVLYFYLRVIGVTLRRLAQISRENLKFKLRSSKARFAIASGLIVVALLFSGRPIGFLEKVFEKSWHGIEKKIAQATQLKQIDWVEEGSSNLGRI